VRVTANAGQKVQARFGAGTGAVAAAPVPVPTTTTPATAPPPAGTGETAPIGATEPPPGGDTSSKRTNLLSPPANMTPVIIGLAVGGVGLVGGIVFAAFKSDSQSKADTVAQEIRDAATKRGISTTGVCTSTNASIQKDFGAACSTLKSNNDKVNTNATIANVSLVVMGVGLVTAVGWYLFAPKKDDAKSADATKPTKSSPVLTPYAGYNNGGFALSGSF
jgi:hypothetical protein